MSEYKATWIQFDDWNILYINGEKVSEGHTLREDHILNYFGVEVESIAVDCLSEEDQEEIVYARPEEDQIELARRLMREYEEE